MSRTLMAYKRRKGFGIRNYVLVISTVQCANAVVFKICKATGAIPITHDKGCCEAKPEHVCTFNTLKYAGCGPNVHSVLLIGLGCEQTDGKALAKAIAADGKRVEYLCIQELGGSPQTVERGIAIVKEMQAAAAAQKREPVSAQDLVVAVQCGGSDWTTALTGNVTVGLMTDHVIRDGGSVLIGEVGGFPGSEHIVAEHAQTYEIGLEILDMMDECRANYLKEYGHTIEEVNPTPGNKAGGITTLVEKSTGNIKKMGSAKVQGILGMYERAPHPGLWILNHHAMGADAVNITACALSGAHLLVFSTGRGTPVGNAIMPAIKLTGNPESYRAMESILDFNAGVVIEGAGQQETGDALYQLVLDVAQGKPTKSELNEDYEFLILYPKL